MSMSFLFMCKNAVLFILELLLLDEAIAIVVDQAKDSPYFLGTFFGETTQLEELLVVKGVWRFSGKKAKKESKQTK